MKVQLYYVVKSGQYLGSHGFGLEKVANAYQYELASELAKKHGGDIYPANQENQRA
jgi:hypothetical protein